MARHRLLDRLQTHRFWLMDVVPSGLFPFFVLGTPVLGFQSITSPEYTFDVDEVKQVNSMFKRSVYSGGAVGPITLQRGIKGYDDSMWQWIHSAITGMDMINRHLLLIQYSNMKAGDVSTGTTDLPGDAWEGFAFLPAKAWLLWDSIPIRYKAGGDFDAKSGEVSIAELDIQPWAVTEFTLMNPVAAAIGAAVAS